MCGIVGYIGKR